MQSLVASGFYMLVLVAALLGAAYAVVYPIVPWGEVLNASSPAVAQLAGPGVAVLVGMTLVGIPFGLAVRVRLGFQESFIANLWMSVGSVVSLGAVVLAIALGAPLPWLVFAFACGPLSASLLNCASLLRSRLETALHGHTHDHGHVHHHHGHDRGHSHLPDAGTARVGAVTVRVAFAPGQGPAIDHDAARRVSAARRRLKVCSMLITSGAILGALSDVLQRGRLAEYGGVYDRTQMESVFRQWHGGPAEWKVAAFERVAAPLAGKRSTPYTPSSRHDFMHNKVLVCDDAVITGSYNLSHSAEDNAENLLVIEDRDLADRYNDYIDGLVKRYGGPG